MISRSTACTYAGLFGGRLFVSPLYSLEEVVVVLEDQVMRSCVMILKHLLSISTHEIQTRRQRMAEISPLMQWGWGGGNPDALTAALAVFTRNNVT